jgi:outer membrane protein assembly factor BamD
MLNSAKTLFLIMSLIFLSSCQHKGKKKIEEESVQIAYQKGLSSLSMLNYKKAAEYFSQIFFINPESIITPKAQLLEIYSFFMAKKYEESIEASESFLKFYPASKGADYATYMNALCHYVQMHPLYLDQSLTEKTKNLFEEFIEHFPHSKFIPFAKNKLIVINEHLAGKQMDIGRYYLSLNDPMAAIVRFQTVLNKYSTTNQIQEALYRLSASFLMIGLENESIRYGAVLGYNFPDSKWYKYNYKLVKSKKIPSSEDLSITLENVEMQK